MQRKHYMKIFTLLLMLTLVSGCVPRKDGAYRGRVIDAETGKPIEGVVVLGVWYKESMTVGGTVGTYYDAKETVTDAMGDFEIQGQGWILANIIAGSLSEMHVMVFKAGYKHVGPGMWSSLKVDGGLMAKKVDWEGDRAIIPIKKLTMEERIKHGPPSRPTVPIEQMKILTKEINKERLEIGLSPFEFGGTK